MSQSNEENSSLFGAGSDGPNTLPQEDNTYTAQEETNELPEDPFDYNNLFSELNPSQVIPEAVPDLQTDERWKTEAIWRAAVDAYLIERSTHSGLAISFMDPDRPYGGVMETLGIEQNDIDPAHGEAYLLTVLRETDELMKTLPINLDKATRLHRRLLPKTKALIEDLLRRTKMERLKKIARDPVSIITLPQAGSAPASTTDGELSIAGLFAAETLPVESIRSLSSNKLSQVVPEYTMIRAVNAVNVHWLLEEIKKTCTDAEKAVDGVLANNGYKADGGVQESIDYELEDQWKKGLKADEKQLLDAIQSVQVTNTSEFVLPLFEGVPGPWIPAGNTFVISEVILGGISHKIQGLFSAIPC